MALPWCCLLRPVASWPISSSMTRAGMPASSNQVAKVWRTSWAPCRSTASSKGSRTIGTADQRPTVTSRSSTSTAARPSVCSSPRALATVAGRMGRRPDALSRAASWSMRWGAAIAQDLQHAFGGWPKWNGWVGQLGHGALVGAVQVVAGQHGPRASGHARSIAAARAASWAGEDQVLGVVAGWELAADGLDHQGGQGHLADAGVALGAGLEAAAEPAGLIAGGANLEHGHGTVEVNPAPAQPS